MVSQAVTIFVNYLFSLISVPFCLNRSGFMLQQKPAEKAFHSVFSGQLLLLARKNLQEMHFKMKGTGTTG